MSEGIVAFIFARGGSKGLPRKNLLPLAGVPLLGHAIRTALETRGVTRCIVSTDDPEIAAVARQFGARTPFMRPRELADDDAPEWLSWQHAISSLAASGLACGTFLSVPTTAPLRTVGDVEACLESFASGGADVVVTVTEARRNPYFNMVTVRDDGSAELVLQPAVSVAGRQSAPRIADMTTVAYVADPGFVMRARGLFDGRVRAVWVPPERAIDIDTELDLRVAELLMAERQRNAEG